MVLPRPTPTGEDGWITAVQTLPFKMVYRLGASAVRGEVPAVSMAVSSTISGGINWEWSRGRCTIKAFPIHCFPVPNWTFPDLAPLQGSRLVFTRPKPVFWYPAWVWWEDLTQGQVVKCSLPFINSQFPPALSSFSIWRSAVGLQSHVFGSNL